MKNTKEKLLSMLLVFVLLFNVLLMSACQMTPPDGGETVVPPADKPVDGPEGGDPDEEDPDDPEAPVVPEPSQPLTPFGHKIEKAIDEALAKIDFCKTSYGTSSRGLTVRITFTAHRETLRAGCKASG